MELENLITSLHEHASRFPEEKWSCEYTIDWIRKYWDLSFSRENFLWHITWSLLITNPERTKVLLMLHKKFQRWQQFGGHCDGDTNVRKVALREFHEESGISIDPELVGDIFRVEVHDIPLDIKWFPLHQHFDIMYLGILPETVIYCRQESEVDEIRWFDIDSIQYFVTWDRLERIHKISEYYL